LLGFAFPLPLGRLAVPPLGLLAAPPLGRLAPRLRELPPPPRLANCKYSGFINAELECCLLLAELSEIAAVAPLGTIADPVNIAKPNNVAKYNFTLILHSSILSHCPILPIWDGVIHGPSIHPICQALEFESRSLKGDIAATLLAHNEL